MYTAKYFKNNDDSTAKEFIRQNGFGILISQVNGRTWATHIPLELSDDGTKLTGHVASANEQWKDFEGNAEVLAIFTGPHAYISPSWYDDAQNVPTWNYVTVHVYGSIRVIDGGELLHVLRQIMNKYENQSENPVTFESLSPEFIGNSVKALVGFEISITGMQTNYKLSQNRNNQSYRNIIVGLENRADSDSHKIADLMKKNRVLEY